MQILKDAVKYGLVGLCAAATDFGSYSLLTYVFQLTPAVANLISRPLGGLVSFTLNKYFTFRYRSEGKGQVQFAKYWVVWGATYALSELMVVLLAGPLRTFGPLAPKLGAELVVVGFSFLCNRHWTFR